MFGLLWIKIILCFISGNLLLWFAALSIVSSGTQNLIWKLYRDYFVPPTVAYDYKAL